MLYYMILYHITLYNAMLYCTKQWPRFCGTAPFSLAIYELDGVGAQESDFLARMGSILL